MPGKYWTEDKVAFLGSIRDGKRSTKELAEICSKEFGREFSVGAIQTVINCNFGRSCVKIWTEERLDFIRSICKGKSTREIAEICSREFGFTCTASSIKSVMSAHKIKSGYKYDGRGNFIFNEEQIEWISENRVGISFEECAKRFNEHFGTDFKVSQVRGFCHAHHLPNGVDCRFKKGNVSHNKGKKGIRFPGSEKGWFKKGHKPHNTVPVNTEVITKDGYISVKVSEPNNWELKHRLVWMRANGPIPEDCCIGFLDNNKQNVELSNLIMIKRSEMSTLNHLHLRSENPEITRAGITLVKIKSRLREIEKK